MYPLLHWRLYVLRFYIHEEREGLSILSRYLTWWPQACLGIATSASHRVILGRPFPPFLYLKKRESLSCCVLTCSMTCPVYSTSRPVQAVTLLIPIFLFIVGFVASICSLPRRGFLLVFTSPCNHCLHPSPSHRISPSLLILSFIFSFCLLTFFHKLICQLSSLCTHSICRTFFFVLHGQCSPVSDVRVPQAGKTSKFCDVNHGKNAGQFM